MAQRIITNSIRCKHCDDVIVSTHRHDFVPCGCGKVFVDGGQEYLRRGFVTSPEDDYEELCTFEKEQPCDTSTKQASN